MDRKEAAHMCGVLKGKEKLEENVNGCLPTLWIRKFQRLIKLVYIFLRMHKYVIWKFAPFTKAWQKFFILDSFNYL